jgi:2-dehydro-3-deoxy-D-arabinonate dehydratase
MEPDMTNLALVRFYLPGEGARTGVARGGSIYDVTAAVGSVGDWLRASTGRVAAAIGDLEAAAAAAGTGFDAAALAHPPAPDRVHWLPPVDHQDIWAAGVTYERSRAARQEEAQDGGDVYARVYTARRPEIFFKAQGAWVVGTHDAVGIRCDATWNVPEPELALVANPHLEIVGYTIGNDMSSRDIEGENPLYLPQAKIYTRSCALGPYLVLQPFHAAWPQVAIRISILRGGEEVFSGATSTKLIRRTPAELVDYLGRCLAFPHGAVLLTGTGVVPPESFTLAAGDQITIGIDGAGELTNHVTTVEPHSFQP